MPRWGSDTPLVGRRDELATLTAALSRAEDGEPSGVLIAGEAGVGKTRLLRSFQEHATSSGALVLTGACLDVGHGLPYLPFREPVAQLADSSEYAELVASIPSLKPLADTEPTPTEDVDPAAVLGGVLRLLERVAAEHTVVLTLEDLHWADESSRNLLRFLLARLRSQRLLVIATYRIDDVYRTHPLRRLLAELIRMPRVERLDLPPLPDDDLRTLLGLLADGAHPHRGVSSERSTGDREDLDWIIQQADGNAFYAEELLAARGTDVPDGLTDLLLTRIERLDPDAQRIVRSASVAGRSVRYELLRSTLSLTDDEVDVGLRDVASHHVMHSDDGEVFVFRHALMREAAYTDLLPGERVRLHAAYAAGYQSEPTPTNAAARAHHLYESNQLSASIHASLEAAEFARRSGAPSQRLAHLENALELWNVVDTADLPDGVTEGDVLRRAAAAAVQSGQLQRAAALGQAAIEASDSDDARAGAMVELAATKIGLEGDAEAFGLTSEALALVPESTVTRLAALAAHARATLNMLDEGEDDRGMPIVDYTAFDETINEALALARQLDRPDIEADVLVTMLANSTNDRQSDEGLEQLNHALELARSAGRTDVEQRVLFNIAIGRYEAAKIDAALHWSAIGRKLARRIGGEDSVYAVALRGIEVLALYHQGSWDEALRRARGGANDHDGHVEMSGGYVRVARGDASFPPWAASRLGIEPGQPKEHSVLSWMHGGSAMIEYAAWERDDSLALEWYSRTRDMATSDFHREPRIRLAALALWAVADVCERVCAEADDLIETARAGMATPQDRWTSDGPEAHAWLAMAEAEYSRMSGDDPIAKFQAAYDAFGYGDRYRQAICQWRIAEQYAAQGDRDRAREHLSDAFEFAAEVAAERLLHRVRDLNKRAGLGLGDDEAPPPGRSPLTGRETEVLRLVAEGRSNREIAELLFITTKTASVHVSNILAKASAKTRTEAAAVGQREGWL